MMTKDDRYSAGQILINFIHNYCQVLEAQLSAVSLQINETVLKLIDDVKEISANTAKEKEFAEGILEETYLNPADDIKSIVQSAQGEIDDLLEELQSSHSGQEPQAQSNNQIMQPTDKIVKNNGPQAAPRLMGQFSKHMEVLSSMDASMQNILFDIVGVLSQDDVLRQRLLHVTDVTRAISVALAYLLSDVSGRLDLHNVLKLQDDMLKFAWNRYTMESEKELFLKFFAAPNLRKVS